MKKMLSVVVLLLSTLFSGCDMFEYHPYDGRVTGETGINAKNIAKIEAACKGKTTIRFVMMGDSQGWFDETEKFVKAVNQRDDIDFVIHGGDFADFGLTKEFLWMRDIMNRLKVPYVGLIGNHDCLGNGEDVFRKVYGDPNFSFMAGNVKFVCLNTNALEYDYSRPVPDFNFIEEQYTEIIAEQEKTVLAMHVPPFSSQFNNNVAKIFNHVIKDFLNLQFCVNAHEHRITAKDLFDDGLMYYGSDCMKNRSYLVFTLKPGNEYDYEVVYY